MAAEPDYFEEKTRKWNSCFISRRARDHTFFAVTNILVPNIRQSLGLK